MEKDRVKEIEDRLRYLDAERQSLTEELIALRSQTITKARPFLGTSVRSATPQASEEKIDLFLSLFRCRENAYPKLWINQKQNKKGYAPACRNEWVSGVCEKPRIKCSECKSQAFLTLDSTAVRNHLQGNHTIGTYAIRADDKCMFLVADFDGDGWDKDVLAYKAAASSLGIEVAIERSRSGNGAHAWIFFREPIAARTARQLGTLIVSRAVEVRYTLSLSTYDRFFPNQDYLPNGGFGNLIALPLQREPRDNGNSVFIDESMTPYEDQWKYLAGLRRLSYAEAQSVLSEFLKLDEKLELPPEVTVQETDERLMRLARPNLFKGLYTGTVEIELGAQLSIKLNDLPGALITAFKRTATFANPKFYELERMRFSTYPHPRFIFCGEVQSNHLILPRGVLDECLKLSEDVGAQTSIRDIRLSHKKMKLNFNGELQPEQKRAFDQILKHDAGILMAPPGAGKTVIGCATIAKRRLPTLILVHRQPLLEQWKEQISRFMDIPSKEIGVYGAAKKKLNGRIDIAMIQSLTKAEELEDLLSSYSQIIIDECHHVPAVSFEALLKRVSSKYILGLTATPFRKDGHHKILFMQCGPIRHEIRLGETAPMTKRVIVRETTLQLPTELGHQPPIHTVWEVLTTDKERLDLVIRDIVASVEGGGFPLVISDRKDHLERMAEAVKEVRPELAVFQLEGTMGKKARKAVLDGIASSVIASRSHCLFSTASLIGEGVDLPHLDTLILAMPISFKGRLVQYAGRLHRPFEGKSTVTIYDYIDSCSGLTISMYRKRLAAYRSMGYRVHATDNVLVRHSGLGQESLFGREGSST